jgi:signal transduction histidine kinase
VSIQDTGKGIPKEEIPKLGQKFYRVGNYLESNKRLDIVRPGGTGLGKKKWV